MAGVERQPYKMTALRYHGVDGHVGNTPLIRLRRLSELTGCEILGKAEFMNPGGSVKDRAALGIILDAEARGLLQPGGTIVEGTAGNTGIGLTLIGHARGYHSVIVIPETQSREKIDLLRTLNYPTDGFRSKSWDEFATPEAPKLDFVFTVCDDAAKETCPVWPGQPMSAHWGVPDPAAVEGSEAVKRGAFAEAFRMLFNRISVFVSLPLSSIDRLSLQKRLDQIGKQQSAE